MAFLSAHIKSAKQEDYTPVQLAASGLFQHRTTELSQTCCTPHEYSLLRGEP